MKLSNLAHDAGHHLSRHRFGTVPASYLFIESVVNSGVLSEAGTNRLNGMVNAAIGRLQNFMTPGASTDLETMLWFVANDKGGINKVKESIAKAGKLQTPIQQDQNWWQELFTIFSLQDPAIQQQIQAKTTQGAGSPPGQDQQNPAQAAQPHRGNLDPNRAAQVMQAMGGGPAQMDPALLAQLQAQGQAVQGNQTELQAMLTKNTAAREASMARIRELQGKIDALHAQRAAKTSSTTPTTEDVFNTIAIAILSEADVKSNLKFVASNLMRRLGYASTTPVQEVNWLKKFVRGFEQRPVAEGFNDFFRNLRTAIANPGHAQMQNQNSELKSYNERAAKLAVRYMTDWLTSEINNRLQVAGLTYQDMASSLALWKKLDAIMRSGKGTPDIASKFQAAQQKVTQIAYALDPKLATGGGTGSI